MELEGKELKTVPIKFKQVIGSIKIDGKPFRFESSLIPVDKKLSFKDISEIVLKDCNIFLNITTQLLLKENDEFVVQEYTPKRLYE